MRDKPDQAARRVYTKTLLGIGLDGKPFVLPVTHPESRREALPNEITSGDIVFKLEDLLGEGGMGEVWKAKCIYLAGPGHEDDVPKYAALKFVRQLFEIPELQERLIKEAKLIAQLDHDNIVPFLGWHHHSQSNSYFVMMEYIKGTDLNGLMWIHRMHADGAPKSLLREDIRRIPDPITGFILFQILNGLAYAHNFEFETGKELKNRKQRGVAHRDISPGNVLIKLDEGSVKIGDFGVAVPTSDLEGIEGQRVIGKIPYMSPEITDPRKKVDKRTDLYSVGVVLYEMLTGLRPNDPFLEESNEMAVYHGTREMFEKKLVPPHEIIKGVDERLSEIACRLLETDPDRRYENAAEARKSVLDCIYSGGVGPTKDSLRDYLQIRQDVEEMPESGLSNLSFLRHHWFSSVPAIFQSHRLTRYARRRLEKRENPARI
ncbi:serine/threonine protein kinase [Candidatus Woesearchaeota archaeon]|nr:serine/threonine protein kinase [Candidatus Woesearchaeota archaeon]